MAASRQRVPLPIGEGDDLGAEPERKGVDPDAAPAADEEMAELVEEHDDDQHEQIRDDVAEQASSGD